jgi:SAM-dependent methyltransferase
VACPADPAPATHALALAPRVRAELEERRARLVSTATGRVLHLRAGAAVTAAGGGSPVDAVSGDALGAVPARAYDTVLAVLALCSVPDLVVTLGHVRRVLTHGGRFLFLEHVPPTGAAGLLWRTAAPAWRRVSGGCRIERDPPTQMRAEGFSITDIERFTMPTFLSPLRSCVAGTARLRLVEPRG